MLESRFWKTLKVALPPDTFHARVESGYSTPGTPDLWVCRGGRSCWVELKVARGRKVLLSPTQVIWHRRCHAVAGRSCVVVHMPNGIGYWHGCHADSARALGLDDPLMQLFPDSTAVWEHILG